MEKLTVSENPAAFVSTWSPGYSKNWGALPTSPPVESTPSFHFGNGFYLVGGEMGVASESHSASFILGIP